MDLTELAASVERVSRHYAATFGIERTSDWQILKLHEEVGELTQIHLMCEGQARPKGHTRAELDERLADEIADVLCHALARYTPRRGPADGDHPEVAEAERAS